MAAVLAACVGVIAGLVILARPGGCSMRGCTVRSRGSHCRHRRRCDLVFNRDPLSSSTWSEAA